MGKINILQPNVFNMISAGEVVERPASVVKELVENAIDAGSTEIDVYVEDGGTKKIVVSDNGTGIAADDLRAAFLPHATSKLKEIIDLDTVSTLGFRGEALASIASVSEITLISRAKNSDIARKIVLSGGKVLSECDDSRAEGTIITVENLFFNTPARLKFLKKPSTELGYITDTVEKIALANPNLKLTLSSENGNILVQEGGDLRDSVMAVYPNLDIERFIPVNSTSSAGITVSGYVSEVDYTAPTRSKQTIIVNGRVVENDTVSTAVDKAYREYLVKRTFPMYVLDIIVPFDEVDVNVHPAKSEVRFRNKNAVFGAVLRAVEEAIMGSFGQEKFGFELKNTDTNPEKPHFEPSKQPEYEQTALDTAALYEDVYGDIPDNKPFSTDFSRNNSSCPTDFPVSETTKRDFGGFDISSFSDLSPYSGKRATSNRGRYAADSQIGVYKNPPLPSQNTADEKPYDDGYLLSKIKNDNDEDFANSLKNRFRLFDGAVIGQIFDTYLIVERGDVVYIIDQHAAHERVLYDKLINNLSAEYSQSLLIPYKLKFSGREEEYFEKLLPKLNQMGFEIEKKTGYYIVYAVPEPVVRMDFEKFTAKLFEGMLDDGDIGIDKLLKETICRDACRAAIKGGDTLSRQQIEYLLSNLLDENDNLPSKCPHGRPAVVSLTKRDVEKMFRRIVQ